MSRLPLHTPLCPQESLGSRGVDSSPNLRRHPDDAHAYVHTRTRTHTHTEQRSSHFPAGRAGSHCRHPTKGVRPGDTGTPATPDCFHFWKTPHFPHRRCLPSAPVSRGCSPGPLSGSPSGGHYAGRQRLCSTPGLHTAPWALAGTA